MNDNNDLEFDLGPRAVISGATIRVNGTARIAGRFEGELAADHTIIDVGGLLVGTLAGENAEILGRLEGKADLDGLAHIGKTGVIVGNLAYGALTIDVGAQLIGTTNPIDGADAPRGKPSQTIKSPPAPPARVSSQNEQEEEHARSEQTDAPSPHSETDTLSAGEPEAYDDGDGDDDEAGAMESDGLSARSEVAERLAMTRAATHTDPHVRKAPLRKGLKVQPPAKRTGKSSARKKTDET